MAHSKWWWGCRGTRSLIHYLWESKVVQPFCKTFCQFLMLLNIHLPNELAILLLGIYSREIIHIKTYIWMFIAVLFIIAPNNKQPKYPSTVKN